MKYSNKKALDNLKSVPMDKRVFIYNAEIILEFLNQTFIPTVYFIKDDPKIGTGGERLTLKDFREEFKFKDYAISIKELYEYYLMFREQKDYTVLVESRFVFSTIIGKLNQSKNGGWCFIKRRYGRSQTQMFFPLLLRIRASEEVRKMFPIHSANLTQGQVEVDYEQDMNEMTEKDEDIEVIDGTGYPPEPQPVEEEY